MEQKLSNDRQIASHRNKYDYEGVPENTLLFAYEEDRYHKMTKEIKLASNILKTKTLEEINLDFRRGDNIVLALKSSHLLYGLIQHFKDNDNDIRQLSSAAVVQVCAIKAGRDEVIEKNYITSINELINDEVPKIRSNAFNAMLNLSEFLEGIDHILQAQILSDFVDKLIEEKNVCILIQALKLIKRLLEGEQGTPQILKTEAISRLAGLLEHKNAEVRSLSAINLACISFLQDGKLKVIELNCVKPLCKRLDDESPEVRESASIALASLAQRNNAKYQIIEYNYFDRIIKLLNDPSEQTKLNIIQLIASLSEAPIGREKAKECLPKLEQMKAIPAYEFLLPYIDMTIEIITWVP